MMYFIIGTNVINLNNVFRLKIDEAAKTITVWTRADEGGIAFQTSEDVIKKIKNVVAANSVK